MKHQIKWLFAFCFLAIILGCGADTDPVDPPDPPVDNDKGYTTPLSYDGLTLVWNDEFDGTSLNSEFWSYDIGTGCPNLCGWGNQELQYYRSENVAINSGKLIITALDQDFENSEYTSGKIVTRDKLQFGFGTRLDIRAKMPKGQGMWPALWLLGVNQPIVGWPDCGEIDIMEMIGGNDRERMVSANAFWKDSELKQFQKWYNLPDSTLDSEYHVFSLIWLEDRITWLINDTPYHNFGLNSDALDAFKKKFYLIMNLAVGGVFPGSPDSSTSFPQQMVVDYIRYFEVD